MEYDDDARKVTTRADGSFDVQGCLDLMSVCSTVITNEVRGTRHGRLSTFCKWVEIYPERWTTS